MQPKLAVGDIAAIDFLDHVEDGAEPLAFVVYGRVAVVGKKHLEILSWAYAEKDVGNSDPNEKRFTIVKSAITKIRKFK